MFFLYLRDSVAMPVEVSTDGNPGQYARRGAGRQVHDRALGILSSGAENRVLEIIYTRDGLRDVTTLTPPLRG